MLCPDVACGMLNIDTPLGILNDALNLDNVAVLLEDVMEEAYVPLPRKPA